MPATRWTHSRLRRLFDRYNKRYWRGDLPTYRLESGHLPQAYGECRPNDKLIMVDVEKHRSDREVRATLLHEMAHAADRTRGALAHGYGFFRELERLLRAGAPIKLTSAEMPGHHILDNVPSRFPLCRRAAQRLERARRRQVERDAQGLDEQIVTDDEIAGQFGYAAAYGLTWKRALLAVGAQWGLLDVGGEPSSARARRIIEMGEREHRKGRRMLLPDPQDRGAFEKSQAQQVTDKKSAIERLPSVQSA